METSLSYGHPDMEIAMEMCVAMDDTVCVIYNKPFVKELSWVEYDTSDHRLDFIMEDGDIRNFGIPVPTSVQPYMVGKPFIAFIKEEDELLVDEVEIPLISREV